ncbi:hypothetical protein [Candidatus Allofournierella excrementigallinarum]|uniref:hypothetical protein n=1 Tax=Candidatus Allofournierella excrementigallinarum TaxID=2838592 RepID=UPI00374F359E
MKKLTALVLALVMCFGLAACGSTPAPSSTPASEPASQPEATNENFVDPVNGWGVYDDLIDQIRTETDLAKRAELMHQAEDILMETGAILPLYFYTDIYLQQDYLTNVYWTPFGYKYFMFAELGNGADTLHAYLASEPD